MISLKDETRGLLLAVIFGPLGTIAASVLAFVVLIPFAPEIRENFTAKFTEAIYFGIGGLFFAYPLTILYGFPVFLLIKKYCKENKIYLLFLSFLPVLLVAMFTIKSKEFYDTLLFIGVFGYYSLSVALSCWLILKASSNKALKQGREKASRPLA